jgi:hypothetical protein
MFSGRWAEAFAAFVEARQDRAVRVAIMLAGDQAAAGDVAQNAFLARTARWPASWRSEHRCVVLDPRAQAAAPRWRAVHPALGGDDRAAAV